MKTQFSISDQEHAACQWLANYPIKNNQFTRQNFTYTGKIFLDKAKKAVGYAKKYRNSIKVTVHDFVNGNQTFNGFDPQFVKNNPSYNFTPKPDTDAPQKPTTPFESHLSSYLALPYYNGGYVPYLTKKLGNERLYLLQGLDELKIGKLWGRDVAIIPIRNNKGEITGLQHLGDQVISSDSNKINLGVKAAGFIKVGDFDCSKKWALGEGVSTVVSSYSQIDIDANFTSTIDAENMRYVIKANNITDCYFIADNDISTPDKNNKGLEVCVENSLMLGLENKQNIFVPSLNNLKVDFNDIEGKENAAIQRCSAIELLQSQKVYGSKEVDRKTLDIKQPLYYKNKRGGETSISIAKLLIHFKSYEGKIISFNYFGKTYNGVLVNCVNGVAIATKGGVFFLPLKSILIKNVGRNGNSINKNYIAVSLDRAGISLDADSLAEYHGLINKHLAKNKDRLMGQRNCEFDIPSVTLKKEQLALEKYLPSEIELPNGLILGKDSIDLFDGDTIFLGVPMGAGKTEFTAKIRNELQSSDRFIAISPRISLVKELSMRCNVEFYQDLEHGDTPLKMATTLHSLPKFSSHFVGKDSIVFIDEFTQVKQIFADGSYQGNNTKLYNDFCDLIQTAKVLIIADAYLSESDIDFIAKLRSRYKMTVINSPNERHNKNVFYHANNETFIAKLKEIAINMRVIIPTNSIAKANELNEIIKSQYPDKKGITITSETTGENGKFGEQNVISFLENINDQAKLYDYIIYTPTISSGVSINDLLDMPDFSVMGYFYNSVGTPFDAMQMLRRYRRRGDINIYIETLNLETLKTRDALVDSGIGSLLLTSESILKADWLDDDAKASTIDSLHKAGKWYEVDDLILELKKNELFEQENYNISLIQLLEIEGYEVIFIDGENDAAKEALIDAKDIVKTNRIKGICNASVITESEQITLSKSPTNKTINVLELERYTIEKTLELEITPNNVSFCVDNPKSIKQTFNARFVLMSDKASLKKELNELVFDKDSFKTMAQKGRKNYAFRREFFTRLYSCVGLIDHDNNSLYSESLPLSIELMQPFYEWCNTRINQINGLGVTPVRSDFNKTLKWVTALFVDLYSFDKSTKCLAIKDDRLIQIVKHLADTANKAADDE